jgi:hypothetical protein
VVIWLLNQLRWLDDSPTLCVKENLVEIFSYSKEVILGREKWKSGTMNSGFYMKQGGR